MSFSGTWTEYTVRISWCCARTTAAINDVNRHLPRQWVEASSAEPSRLSQWSSSGCKVLPELESVQLIVCEVEHVSNVLLWRSVWRLRRNGISLLATRRESQPRPGSQRHLDANRAYQGVFATSSSLCWSQRLERAPSEAREKRR
jgi:hypothetical protein